MVGDLGRLFTPKFSKSNLFHNSAEKFQNTAGMSWQNIIFNFGHLFEKGRADSEQLWDGRVTGCGELAKTAGLKHR